ncbi:Uncharacterised protein [Bordetella pertussis]|nr:Uncharacterised protein [Bordetella pertussis]
MSLNALTISALTGLSVKSAGKVSSMPSTAGPAMALMSGLPTPSGPMNLASRPCSAPWRSSRPISG